MNGSIFVISDDDNFIEMHQERYENEQSFQTLIEKYPNLLAGEQITPDNPRKWLLVAREIGIPMEEDGSDRWYLDHLFVDQDAIPTLVEVKRVTDTRIRREVVAQMLDYAANASLYWTASILRNSYTEQMRKRNTSTLADIGISPDAESDFWHNVENNLKLGKMRLMFVADKIPITLQNIIEFLDKQMVNTDVLGLEIRQYVSDGGMKTLVPTIVSRTASAGQAKQREKGKWSEDTFLQDILERTGDEECVQFCRKLLRACEERGLRIWWGEGKTSSSFVAIHDGKARHQLFAVWPTRAGAVIELYFQHLKEPLRSIEARRELKQRFEQIDGLRIPDGKLDKRPNISWKIMEPESSFKQFMEIIADMKNQIMRYEDISS